MLKRILILAATSTICRHVALQLAKPGDRICLAARNLPELSRIASDLALRNSCEFVIERRFDAFEFGAHAQLVEDCVEALGGIDVVVIGSGELGDQIEARNSIPSIRAIIDSNYTGIATILASISTEMLRQGGGHIVVLSSVAGDRGRQSNYIYGSAKCGISTYLEGLENRLHRHGIRVSTIKLGFVDTRMIFTTTNKFLVASPTSVGKQIAGLVRKGRSGVTYIPGFWRYIMFIISIIPSYVFKRMSL